MSEEVFVISKIKNAWTYVITDLNGECIVRTFYEKELSKTNKEEFSIEKVIKRKGNNGNVMIIFLIAGPIKKAL